METWHETRRAIRRLLKTPSFTVSAVLLMGLGVGSFTTIFTLVDQILLRPLPYPEAERLVVGVTDASFVPPTRLGTPDLWRPENLQDPRFADQGFQALSVLGRLRANYLDSFLKT
jgi:hypothetical protein